MYTECVKSLVSFTTRYVVKTNSVAALDHNDTHTHTHSFSIAETSPPHVCVSAERKRIIPRSQTVVKNRSNSISFLQSIVTERVFYY